MNNRGTFIATMRAQGCPDTWAFQDDGTGGFHNHATEWAYIGWNRGIESQAAQIAALTAERDTWIGLYRRAINEANGLTNYVEDRPELRSAEKRLSAIEAAARTQAPKDAQPTRSQP